MRNPWQPYSDALTLLLFDAWGKPLRPLTLGHLAAFRAYSHPLMGEGEGWSVGQVALGVMLGRMTGTQAMGTLSDPEISRKANRFAKKHARYQVTDGMQSLRAWWGHYLDAPDKWRDANTKEPKAPIEWMIMYRLCGKSFPGGERMAEIWNLPCNVAFCMATVHGVLNGDDSPMTPDDCKIIEQVRAMP